MGVANRKSLFPHQAILIFVLVIFCIPLLFFNLGKKSFWEPDEGRYAEIAREMIESGDWLTPRLNYIKHFDKPPLAFWFIGASFVLFGYNEFAAHLPLVLISLLGVLTTFFLGAHLFDRRIGFLAAIILISSWGYAVLSRLLTTDIILAFVCILCYFLFTKQKYLLFYLALALGLMTKGPVIFILTLIPIFIFLGYTKNISTLRQMKLGWGLLLVVLVGLPWYIYQVSINQGLLHDWVVQQTYNRIVRPIDDPFYFFIPILGLLFFPQIFFLIPAWKRYVSCKRTPVDKEHTYTLLLCIWFFVPFIFFSCIGKKLVTYMLPLLAPLAILVARFWDEAMQNMRMISSKIFTISYWLYVAFLSILVVSIIVFITLGFDARFNIVSARAHIIALSIILACGIGASIPAFRLKKTKKLFWVLTLTSVFFLLATVDLLPKIEASTGRSLKALALKIKEDLQPQDKVVNYRCFLTSLPYYLARRTIVVERQRNIAYEEDPADYKEYLLENKDDLYRLMKRHKVYCITYTWEFEKIKEEYPQPLYFLGQARKYVLFVNQK